MSTLTAATRDVLAERERQVTSEGWTAKHDDKHADGSLALAAACYACNAATWAEPPACWKEDRYAALSSPGFRWPWLKKWWKPKSRRHDLVRAAALILAEIERIDRREARGPICSDCGARKGAPHNYGCMHSELDV